MIKKEYCVQSFCIIYMRPRTYAIWMWTCVYARVYLLDISSYNWFSCVESYFFSLFSSEIILFWPDNRHHRHSKKETFSTYYFDRRWIIWTEETAPSSSLWQFTSLLLFSFILFPTCQNSLMAHTFSFPKTFHVALLTIHTWAHAHTHLLPL